jgi:hypothetical protein
VTDVGLGATSGIALAARARELRPDLAVLFVSGQPDLDHSIDEPVAVLGKPFSLGSLVNAAERLTDGARRRTAPAAPGVAPGRAGAPVPGSGPGTAAGEAGPPVVDLVSRLLDARDEELAAIAGHLHDEHLQQLAAVTLRLGLLRVRGLVSPQGDTELAELEQVLLGAAERIRAQVLDLSPSWLQEATLAASLEVHAARCPELELHLPDDDVARRLRVGPRGHRILQALMAELATWDLDDPVEVEVVAAGEHTLVRVTAAGRPPAPRPTLRAEELAALSALPVQAVTVGVSGERVRRHWDLHLR